MCVLEPARVCTTDGCIGELIPTVRARPDPAAWIRQRESGWWHCERGPGDGEEASRAAYRCPSCRRDFGLVRAASPPSPA
jgi:hypothetical protein